MSRQTAGPALAVRVEHTVHPGLKIEVQFDLGAECGALFGPSGAGKTTLLRLIAGLVRPDSGRVVFAGEVVFDSDRRIDAPLRSRRVGMIFQEDLLFPHLDVAGNVRFGLASWPRPQAESRLEEVAALCGIDHLLQRRPDRLSGGERQRVGLARALAPRPRLLLCDEPVSALDLAARNMLIEQLREVNRAEQTPILYVTHSPAEAIALGSKLFALREGRIIATGPPLDVLAATLHGAEALADVRNAIGAIVAGHDASRGETFAHVPEGPDLVVPLQELEVGARVTIAVRAEDILLARDVAGGLSARNRILGTVERIVPHDALAEVVVGAGATRWLVSVVAAAVDALELRPGSEVQMIFKARSCHVVATGHAPASEQAAPARGHPS